VRKLLSAVFFFLFLLVLVSLRERRHEVLAVPPVAIGCGPSPVQQEISTDEHGAFVPVLPGWGHYSHKIQTGNDSAQFFFDQGLNMYYSYHLTEALASFKEAARRDTTCVMAYVGQALAMGPYYNSGAYKMPAAVLPVLQQMNRLAAAATDKEKGFADAMNKRYSADTSDSRRKELNHAYSLSVAALLQRHPEDPDIKALYVDAVMLEHCWDFWENDGKPRSWTMELVTDCEEILKVLPTHPAALHYQIHLVEASLHPESALPNADALQEMLPGVSHMVHMASHMYQRNGLYAKGVAVNLRAAGLQGNYDSIARNLKLGIFALTHFDGVGAFCALNANMYGKALQMSSQGRDILWSAKFRSRLSYTFFQYLYMLPTFARVRSGKWKELLEAPAPDSSLHFALLLDEFGKGMAAVRSHDEAAAKGHLERLRALSKYPELLVITNAPFKAPIEEAKIAGDLLAGEIAFSEKRPDEGIRLLEAAVTREDALVYREPKEWPIPVRHYLGAHLLALGKKDEAKKVYEQDLVLNPGNGWSLLGLYQCLGTAQYKAAYLRAFSDAEEIPAASAY
jgi:tetratricopeptide (TPR) repeat protein